METFKNIVLSIISSISIIGILGFLGKTYIDSLFQKKHVKYIEDVRWEAKIREQAASVAEYLALAKTLEEGDSPDRYRKINQLAMELAMWLPAGIYRAMGKAVVKNDYSEIMPVLIDVRKILLGEKYDPLSPDDFILHKPGIGRQNQQKY